jgi:O-antigen ligase
VLLVLHRKRLHFGRVAAIAGAAAAAAVAAGLALPAFAALYWGRLSGTFQFLFAAGESLLSGRAETWRLLGRFLMEHPLYLLFGTGYKTLAYTSVAGQPLIVDNMYLSMLAETGLVGLAALLLLNGSILAAAYRARRSFAGAWIFSFWVGQMFQMLSGDLLTYWRVLPVYFWVLAIAVRRA